LKSFHRPERIGIRKLTAGHELTENQLSRVKECKRLLGSVDKKSFDETVAKLEGSDSVDGNLLIMEAVAKTYADIVRSKDLQDQKKKEWLYSMVLLNMAYFQLSGGVDDKNENVLNLLIRQKLKGYLPKELFSDPKLFHSIE
jgi:hypothetical protein